MTPPQKFSRFTVRKLVICATIAAALVALLPVAGAQAQLRDSTTSELTAGQTTRERIAAAGNKAPTASKISSRRKASKPRRPERRRQQRIVRQQRLQTTPVSATFSSEQVQLAFDPALDGFAFANWSGSHSNDLATDGTLRRLFGDQSVCKETTVDTCTPFDSVAGFIERFNNELRKGRCEGMAALALHRFSLGQRDTSALTQADISAELAYWSATQLLPAVRTATTQSRSMSLRGLADSIATSLRSEQLITLGLHGDFGGHTLAPFAITLTHQSANIKVYDPNYPSATATLSINFETDSWRYEIAGSPEQPLWTGGTGGISMVPLAARHQQPVSAFSVNR